MRSLYVLFVRKNDTYVHAQLNIGELNYIISIADLKS